MSLIKAIGIDLAQLVFSIHAVDEYGKTKLKQTVKRNKLLETIANIPPSIIGMDNRKEAPIDSIDVHD